MFSCEISEISKNTYFEEHLWTTASKPYTKPYIDFKFDLKLSIAHMIKITAITKQGSKEYHQLKCLRVADPFWGFNLAEHSYLSISP